MNGSFKGWQRAWRHLTDGTVFDRLRWERDYRRQRRRESWWSAREGQPTTFRHRIAGGAVMKLTCDDMLAKAIFLYNFEADERKFVRAFLNPGDIFIDVGANIGLFTLTAAAKVGPSGRVYAFEPGPRAVGLLEASVELNRMGCVTIFPQAMSDTVGVQSLHLDATGFDALHSLGTPLNAQTGRVVSIETNTLDLFVQQAGIAGRIKMMKIDVEGWEGHVIAGGKNTLGAEDSPVLQVEFTEAAARGAGSSCRELYGQLQALGYGLYRYEAARHTLVPDVLADPVPSVNLYAIKDLPRVLAQLNPSEP